MTLIADFLVAAGGFLAALYCYLLSRRLRRFTALESGMGSAIAVLSAQVDEMNLALSRAKASAENSSDTLERQVRRAETAMARLEVLLASTQDLQPDAGEPPEETGDDRRVRFVRKRLDRNSMRVNE